MCNKIVTVDANDHDWTLDPKWEERSCIVEGDDHELHMDATGDMFYGMGL